MHTTQWHDRSWQQSPRGREAYAELSARVARQVAAGKFKKGDVIGAGGSRAADALNARVKKEL